MLNNVVKRLRFDTPNTNALHDRSAAHSEQRLISPQRTSTPRGSDDEADWDDAKPPATARNRRTPPRRSSSPHPRGRTQQQLQQEDAPPVQQQQPTRDGGAQHEGRARGEAPRRKRDIDNEHADFVAVLKERRRVIRPESTIKKQTKNISRKL
jgi:hypothetical protein